MRIRGNALWGMLAAALFAGGVAQAEYVVVFKDGSAVMAKERFRVRNGLAILRTSEGQLVSVPAEHVDTHRTEEANAADAVVLDRSEGLKKFQEVSPEAPSPTERRGGAHALPLGADGR